MLIIFFGVFILLFILGIPVAFCLGISSLIYLVMIGDIPLTIMTQRMAMGCDSFPLLAIPFFVLAAQLMNTTGITQKIFNFAGTLVRHIPGGLAHVNIIDSMIFAGMSGSAVADASGIGMLEIEAMVNDGYDKPFSAALSAASSTIGPIIPPSIPMVIYGSIAEASIGALFLGGFIPGVTMGLAMMVITYFISRERGYAKHLRATFVEFLYAFKEAALALITPVIILGGIYTGIFTPTEAAVVAVVYALFLGIFVYREIKLHDLVHIFVEVVVNTAFIMFIVATASLFGWILARERIPQMMSAFFLGVTNNKWVMLFILNLLFLILGCFMETIAIMSIFIPIVLPIIKAFQIDIVHFGVVMVLNLMIGLLTPPFGMLLFIVSGFAKVPMDKVIKELIPYIIILISVLLLITYVPSLVMFLPGLAGVGR